MLGTLLLPRAVKNSLKQVADLITYNLSKATFNHTGSIHNAVLFYAKNRGKMIRPLCLLLLYHYLQLNDDSRANKNFVSRSKTESDIITLAAVTEMVHVASLISDDVIDNASLRRSLPTVWYSFDQSTALRSTNIIVSQALLMLCDLDNTTARPEIITRLTKVLSDLVCGEYEQLKFSSNYTESKRCSKKKYFETTYLKTASIFANSFRCAAILNANKYPDPRVNQAFKLGLYFGQAFQIADDIIDYTSSKLLSGKSIDLDRKNRVISAPLAFIQYPGVSRKCSSANNEVQKQNDSTHLTQGLNNASQALDKVLNESKKIINSLFGDSAPISAFNKIIDIIQNKHMQCDSERIEAIKNLKSKEMM